MMQQPKRCSQLCYCMHVTGIVHGVGREMKSVVLLLTLGPSLRALCVSTIRAGQHSLFFTVLVNLCIQVGVTLDYGSYFGAVFDVRSYTIILIQFTVVHRQVVAHSFLLSNAEWVDHETSTSKITATLVVIAFSRAEAMLAQLSAWTQLCVFL